MSQDVLSVGLCSGLGQYHSPNAEKNPQAYLKTALKEIVGMAANPPHSPKETARWAIFSTLKTRTYSEQRNRGKFYALWADIDDPAGLTAAEIFAKAQEVILGALICYTTRSAKPEKQKCRVIVPLAEPVDGHSYAVLAKILNDKLEAVGITPDRRTQEPGQICYLPNRGEFYHFDLIKADGPLHPSTWDAEVLAERERIAAADQALVEARERARLKAAERMRTGAKSPIEAFNAAYSLEDVSLPMYGYQKRGDRWLSPNSETGNPGVKVSDDGLKWISSHGSDAGIGTSTKSGATMGDAFDLFTHYEHQGNRDAAIKAAGAMFTTSEGCTLTEGNQRAYREQQAHDHAQGQFRDISGGGQDENGSKNGPDEKSAKNGATNKTEQPQQDNPQFEPGAIWENPVNLIELIDTEPAPVKWFAQDRIVHGRGLLLCGMGGSSKTRAMYQLGVGAALGRVSWGWDIVSTGKSVLILTEDIAEEVHRTIHNICHGLGLTRHEKAEVYSNLVCYPLAGEHCTLLALTKENAMVETDLFRRFEDKISSLGNVAFVGIDPALSVTTGNELDQGHARALGRMSDRLAVRVGATVCMVAHAAKNSLMKEELDSHNSRGAGAITDAVRSEISMRTMTAKEAKSAGVTSLIERKRHVQMAVTKGNLLPPDAYVPVWLRRDTTGTLCAADLEFDTGDGPSRKERSALEVLQTMCATSVPSLAEWRGVCAEHGLIKDGTADAQKKAMDRIKDALKKYGLIEKGHGRGVWVPTDDEFDFNGA